ncbi:hypothetical protein BDQ17DRAFT_1369220 [Cyathus striatus]|nr:hypothetical protein BDQ17DRAFT_1380158 [Cyathus striatus]KAF8992680.1 hypothetical protein BDQ17DRAFT_1369220 [Cyathus striatus]
MEYAIVGLDSEKFSDDGKSGAIVIDSHGRVAALLTGGAKSKEFGGRDVTYAIPFHWILQRLKARFPDIMLYPTT